MDTCLCAVQFLLVCFIAMSIEITTDRYSPIDEERPNGLVRAYIEVNLMFMISHLVYLAAYIRLSVLVSEARGQAVLNAVAHGILAVLWALLLAVSSSFWGGFVLVCLIAYVELEKASIIVWLIAPVMVKLFPSFSYTPVPVNVPLYAERAGLIVIVALGEVVASVYAEDLKARSYGVVAAIVVQAFLLKFAYFDVFDGAGERVKRHALKVGYRNSIWNFRLLYIQIGSILCSAMYLIDANRSEGEDAGEHRSRALTDEYGDDHDDDDDESDSQATLRQVVYAGSLVCAVLSSYFMGRTHEQYPYLVAMQRVPVLARTAFVLFAAMWMIIAAAVTEYDEPLSLISIECIIVAVCLFVEFMCKWILLKEANLPELPRRDQAPSESHNPSKKDPGADPRGENIEDNPMHGESSQEQREQQQKHQHQSPPPIHSPATATRDSLLLKSRMQRLSLDIPSAADLRSDWQHSGEMELANLQGHCPRESLSSADFLQQRIEQRRRHLSQEGGASTGGTSRGDRMESSVAGAAEENDDFASGAML